MKAVGFPRQAASLPGKDGAFYLVGYGEFWEFGSFVSEVLSLRRQVRTGYFKRKVQLFLDQQPLVVGCQVRPRQQLQQVLPEGWSHVPQQVRGVSYLWKQARLASALIKELHGCPYDLISSIPSPLPSKFPFRDRKGDPLPCLSALCQLGCSKFRLKATLISGVHSRQHKLEFLGENSADPTIYL